MSDDPALTGPYDAETNGRCSNGHPVNGYGRCEPLNAGNEPEPAEQSQADQTGEPT